MSALVIIINLTPTVREDGGVLKRIFYLKQRAINNNKYMKTTVLSSHLPRPLLLLLAALAVMPAHAFFGEDPMVPILMIVVLVASIGLTIALLMLVASMAKRRNRNVVLWLIFSMIASPIIACIILYAIGEDENNTESHFR
jgi:O-antigen ligase